MWLSLIKTSPILLLIIKKTNLNWSHFKDYDANDLADFEETILKGCDFNRDGKISKKELTMILLALSRQTSDE